MKRRSFLAAIAAALPAIALWRIKPPTSRPVYVFEVWDEEWIAAHSAEEAAEYARRLVPGYMDIPECLSDEEMRREGFWEIDGQLARLTFQESLYRDLQDGVKVPYYFASTFA